MSKFKLEFTLKQHTPMIHFQSDQHGATLRATELKPKLDRFLLERVKGIPFIENANGHKSLDYKVKIEANVNISDIETINARNGRTTPNPLFFGNMGDEEHKRFSIASKVSIVFFSFNNKILEAIKNNFEAFLANTNFGTRQSKGFGSFYLTKPFNKSLVNQKIYSFNSTEDRWQEDIKHFYAFLRAGINTASFGGIYAKAVIFAYAKSQGITWDKKAIKMQYMNNELENQQEKYSAQNTPLHYQSPNQRLMRDLFGLSSSQSWMSYKKTITKEHPEIDRFKSPLTFKPIKTENGMKIYFWADKSVEKILNKEFLIKVDNRGDLMLSTPVEFSFDAFFEFAFNLDLSKHIDPEYHDNGRYKKLEKMFREIKEAK